MDVNYVFLISHVVLGIGVVIVIIHCVQGLCVKGQRSCTILQRIRRTMKSKRLLRKSPSRVTVEETTNVNKRYMPSPDKVTSSIDPAPYPVCEDSPIYDHLKRGPFDAPHRHTLSNGMEREENGVSERHTDSRMNRENGTSGRVVYTMEQEQAFGNTGGTFNAEARLRHEYMDMSNTPNLDNHTFRPDSEDWGSDENGNRISLQSLLSKGSRITVTIEMPEREHTHPKVDTFPDRDIGHSMPGYYCMTPRKVESPGHAGRSHEGCINDGFTMETPATSKQKFLDGDMTREDMIQNGNDSGFDSAESKLNHEYCTVLFQDEDDQLSKRMITIDGAEISREESEDARCEYDCHFDSNDTSDGVRSIRKVVSDAVQSVHEDTISAKEEQDTDKKGISTTFTNTAEDTLFENDRTTDGDQDEQENDATNMTDGLRSTGSLDGFLESMLNALDSIQCQHGIQLDM